MFPNYCKEYGYFKSDGAAHSLEFSDTPDIFTITNLMAAAGEISTIKWFKDLGDSKCIVTRKLADNGVTTSVTEEYLSSGGYITQLNNDHVDTVDPVTHHKQQGITIDTSWLDDNDEVYWEAEFNVPFRDEGDLGA